MAAAALGLHGHPCPTALNIRLSPRGDPGTAGARRRGGDGADTGRPVAGSR